MELAKEIVAFLIAYHMILAEGLILVFSGIIMIALIIPGEQPEKALQKVVDLLKKISKKKS
jgi:hypothetical protein